MTPTANLMGLFKKNEESLDFPDPRAMKMRISISHEP
jgi:hypothetical protein